MRLRSLGVLVLFAALAVAPSAMATDYYADVSGGVWTTNTTWHLGSTFGAAAPAGTYPGSAAGDKAIIDFQGIAITLAATVPNAVTIDFNNISCSLTVNGGGSLPLTGASQVAGGTILILNGGTVDNGGTLTIASTSSITWNSGTLTGAGTTVISAGADVNATGTSMILTGGQTLSIFDTFTYGPIASGFAVNSGASVQIQSGGLFDIQNANGIGSDGVGGANITVNSGGTFLKSADNFGTNIDPILNNNGLVQVDVSTLVLNDGTHTGTFFMNGASTGIALLNTPILNGATISGGGTAALDHTTIQGTVSATNITFDGFGSLSGNGTLNLSNKLDWAGGSISGITLNAALGSLVNITGAANTSLESAAHLNNAGTMTVNPGATFSIISDAHITNNGTINIAGDVTIAGDGAPLARIDNLATRTLSKTSGAGAAFIGVAVNNDGALSSLAGILKLQNGGAHTGNFFTGTSAAIAFDGGVHRFTGSPSLGGTGTYGLIAGTMDVDTNITMTATFQQSGGTLTGSGAFTLAGTFLWTGGQMDNSSGNGQTVLSGGSAQIAGTTSNVVLLGRILVNSGTLTYNPTPGIELSIDSAATLINTGTFNLVGDTEIDSNGVSATFNNGTGGVINKSTGAGTATFFCAYDGSGGGTLNISSGTITLAGGGTNLGNVNFANSGNQLILDNSVFTHSVAPTFTGNGALVVTGPGASLGINPTLTINNLIFSSGQIAGGTLTVNNSMVWQSGKMLGGVTNINSPASLSATAMTGAITLDTHSLTVAAGSTFTWNGAFDFQLINGSSFINNGTFNATGGGQITGTPPANAITNNGTFKKTGGATATRIDPVFGNSGSLSSEVNGQSLIINGGGSQTGGGSMNTVSGAFLDFFGGTYSVSSGTSPFQGSGNYRVNGGTLAILGSMNMPFLTTLFVGSGALDVAPGATFSVNNLQWTGGTLQNDGTTVAFVGSIFGATTLNNDHTLALSGGAVIYSGSAPNQLTIGGTANLDVQTGGTLQLTSGSTIAGTSPDGLTINGGTVTVTGTVTLNCIGTMTSGTMSFSGGAQLALPSNTFTVNGGTLTNGAFIVSGGTLNINTNPTLSNLTLSAGTFGGTGTVTLNAGIWSGGTMTGTGSTVVNTGATFVSGTTNTKQLSRNLTNNGTVNTSANFTFTGAAVVTNNNTWNDNGNSAMPCSSCTGKFINAAGANFNRNGSLVNNYFMPFDNNGTVTNLTNTGINFSAGGTHTGDFASGVGALRFGGTHTFSAASDVTGQGNILFGSGTFTLSGTYVITGVGLTQLLGANLIFNTVSPATTPYMILNGGSTVGGTAAVHLTGGTSTWSGAILTGTGGFNVGASAILDVTAGTLDGRTITNSGIVNLKGNVSAGPTPGAALNNLGTFNANPVAAVAFAPAFTNQAQVNFLSSSVAFNGGYTQTAGTTSLAGGSFSSPFTVNINGGTVTGNGTISANVANDGAFAPGTSPGTITVSGNYTQTASGSINSELAGNTPGTGYDQLVVTGTANLDGTINVSFISGFTPADNDVFDLVTWGTHTGAFANVNLPAYPAGTLTPTYETNAFRITADTVGDLVINKSGPTTAGLGDTIVFTVAVGNNGPSPMSGVVVNDTPTSGLTFLSNSGDCTTAFPCSLGTINANASKTINSTFKVTNGAGTTQTNTATVSSTSTDSVSTNNSDSQSVFVELADLSISKTGPASATVGSDITFQITVINGGASTAQNVVVNDPTPTGLTFISNSGACTDPFPCNLGGIVSSGTKIIFAKYSVNGAVTGDTITNVATVTTTTTDNPGNNSDGATVAIACLNSAPDQLSPTGDTEKSGTLSWRGTGASYVVYLGPVGTGCSTQFATTTAKSVPYSNLAPGTYEWRVESLDPGCRTISSSCVRFTIAQECTVPGAPLVSVVGQTTSAKTYELTWDPVPGANRYEVDEATNADFIGATRIPVTGTSLAFKHDVTEATAFYYRVHAFTECVQTPGPFSPTVRVVIIPLPPKDEPRKDVNVPVGSEEVIVQQVFIPGEPNQNLTFTATTDRPWLAVRPASGVITPAGITLEVVADPKNLPNGTFTASIIVTINSANGRVGTDGVTVTSVPFSINLVTPVTPVTNKPGTSPYALVIPSAGHLDGIGSHWQSDIRVTNAGFKSTRYRLTFTPSGGTAQGVKQTDITVDAGATTALDDIISNWFGLGTLGDGANGMLEILPLDDPANTSLTTVASSRTYNVTGNGTLGQYIPTVPFPKFIGKALPNAQAQVLSLQQIAENASYRTNVGLAEAGGAAVNATLSIFNSSGTKLKDVPVQLAAGEQRQLNQLLASNGIELADGRVEVKVTGGDGKITAYASVVDSHTQDPLLVSGELLSGSGSSKYVLPGVANLDNASAHWRTDMRVFNYGNISQPATLTFFPFNNGPSKSVNVLLSAGQIVTLDNVLASQFQRENEGGVVHLSTPQPASLVVTGRTYNQTDAGTFGQFVPAVTTDQAVGAGGRTLHILQVEDSSRYRTNVGLAEVTGKPVTVEMQIVLPDSKITPTVQITLGPNEFQQFNPIRALEVGNVYNARITVRVIGGEGRVTAYGSVIDEITQDPTYVPAQ